MESVTDPNALIIAWKSRRNFNYKGAFGLVVRGRHILASTLPKGTGVIKFSPKHLAPYHLLGPFLGL
jgi:hypothetical protein